MDVRNYVNRLSIGHFDDNTIFLYPIPGSAPQAKKRTYSDRKNAIPTSPISKSGFTTRLPCPVNVTVQAQPNTNSRGTYLAPLT